MEYEVCCLQGANLLFQMFDSSTINTYDNELSTLAPNLFIVTIYTNLQHTNIRFDYNVFIFGYIKKMTNSMEKYSMESSIESKSSKNNLSQIDGLILWNNFKVKINPTQNHL